MNHSLRRHAAVISLITLLVFIVGCSAQLREPQVDLRKQPGIEGDVARWLDAYQQAWNYNDSRRIAQLRGLNAADAWTLDHLLRQRANMRVTLSDVRIRKVDETVAAATYARVDRWNDATTGQQESDSGVFEHVFRLDGNQLREVSLHRR